MNRDAPLSRTLTRLGIGLLAAGTVAELAVVGKWLDVHRGQAALQAELDDAVERTRRGLRDGAKLERYDNGEYWIVGKETPYAPGVRVVASSNAIELNEKATETEQSISELESIRLLLEPFVRLLAAPIAIGLALVALFGRLPRSSIATDPVIAAPPVEPPPADE